MRSGLQPVATTCNERFYYGPCTALVEARTLSQSTSGASDTKIECNFIGTDPSGQSDLGNGENDVLIRCNRSRPGPRVGTP